MPRSPPPEHPLAPMSCNNSDAKAKPKPMTVARSYWSRRHLLSQRRKSDPRTIHPIDVVTEQDPPYERQSREAGETAEPASGATLACGKWAGKHLGGGSSPASSPSTRNETEIIESTARSSIPSSSSSTTTSTLHQPQQIVAFPTKNPTDSMAPVAPVEMKSKHGRPPKNIPKESSPTKTDSPISCLPSPPPSARKSPETTDEPPLCIPSPLSSARTLPTTNSVPSPGAILPSTTDITTLCVSSPKSPAGTSSSSKSRTSPNTSHPIIDGLRLFDPDDVNILTPPHCFVRSKLLEVYVVPLDDPKRPTAKNIAGIRCSYCSSRSKEEGSKGGRFFPKSIADIYQGVMYWQRKHLLQCKYVPDECKEHYKQLKEQSSGRRKIKTLPHWIESALTIGLRNIDDNRSGITYQPESSMDANSTRFVDSGNDAVVSFGGNIITKETIYSPNGQSVSTTDVDEKAQDKLEQQANTKSKKDRQDKPDNSKIDVAVIDPSTSRRKRGRPPKKVQPEMVQCDKCKTWCTLPANIEGDSLPKVWNCSMKTCGQTATCSGSEEPPLKRRRGRPRKEQGNPSPGVDLTSPPSLLSSSKRSTATCCYQQQNIHHSMLQQLKERVNVFSQQRDFYENLLPCIANTVITSYTLASTKFTTMTKTDVVSNVDMMASLPQQGLQFPGWGREKKQELNKIFSLTQIEHEKQRSTKRWIIPKWIPDDSGGYFYDDSTFLLFTPSQFVKNVIIEAEKDINKLDREHHSWKATISSNDSHATHAYIVEAEGTHRAMEVLEESIQIFVRIEIERCNLNKLVNDDNSLVLDVHWGFGLDEDPTKQTLGVRIGGVHICDSHKTKGIGAYIKKIYQGTIIEKAIGRNAIHMGCALLAVNDMEITDASKVGKIVQEAKSKPRVDNSTVSIKLTLCLSKYADLSEAQNLPKLNLRKRDGSLYNQVEHENLRIDCWIRSQQGLDQGFIQQQVILAQQQTLKEVEEDEIEVKSDSSASNLKVQTLLTPNKKKRRKKTAEDNDEKIRKRQKKKYKEDISDSQRNSADLLARKQAKRTPNDGIKNFWHFEQKLKPLYSLDFKDTKINSKLVCSSMWRKHKELFGEDAVCGEKCRCIMRLPEMVESVIHDHVAREKKMNRSSETDDELRKQTRGICKYFAPKFVHLLDKEYPNESESRLISRLVDMWEVHQQNRMYGITCKQGCGCQEEWDQIFGKGNKYQAKLFAKRASLLNKRVTSEASHKSSPAGPLIPRKKRANSSPPLIERTQHVSKKTVREKRIGLGSLISSITSRKELYEVDFGTSSALGGYFRTEGNPPRCIVYSTYEGGQLDSDKRIVSGAAVVSVITGETRNTIHNHNDLKSFYENAKRTRSRLSILFENQKAKPGRSEGGNEWDDSGQWIGSGHLDENDGWPGGAKIAQKPQLSKITICTQTDTAASLREETPREVTGENTSAVNTMQNANVPEWTSIVNTTEPGHKTRAPKKPLTGNESTFLPDEPTGSVVASKQGIGNFLPSATKKSRRNRNHSKKVTFSQPANKEIYFCKNEAANVRRVLSNVQVEVTDTSPKVLPNQTLLSSIRNGSCKDMLQILQTQPTEDPDLESHLQKEYTFVGNEMHKIQKRRKDYGPSDGVNQSSHENDYYAKYRALSIYIHCIHLIERAVYLKKWYVLDIELKYIDIVPESHTLVDVIKGDVSVKMQNGNLLNDLGHLPIRQFSQHMSYSDNDNPKVYTVHNNKSFRFDQREFIIDLKKGSLHGSARTERNIGCFRLKLDDIEEKCRLDECPIEYIQSLSQDGSKEFSSGYVTVTAKKRKADKVYIREKQKDTLKRLHQQLAQIERFNQDPKIPSGTKLTGNIFGINGKSMLHAAVQLLDDRELVEKLLILEADPRSCDHLAIGTPLSLAQTIYYRVSERGKNMCKNDADLELHEKRSKQARLLVDMLQNHVVEPVAAATDSAGLRPKQSFRASRSSQSDAHSNMSLSDPNPKDRSSPIGSDRLPPRIAPSAAPSMNTGIGLKDYQSQHLNRIEEEPNGNQSISGAHHETNPAVRLTTTPGIIDTTTPVLPRLSNPDWFVFNQAFKNCLKNPIRFRKCLDNHDCRFWKRRTCRFWHILPDPSLRERKMPPTDSLPALSDLPPLSHDLVKYMGVNEWFTAAYADEYERTVIYVQKVLPASGFVGDDGVCWFRSKEAALTSLRYNVYFEKRRNSSSSGPHGRSTSADVGRNHDRDCHRRNPSHHHHQYDQHQHQHQHQQHHQHHQHENGHKAYQCPRRQAGHPKVEQKTNNNNGNDGNGNSDTKKKKARVRCSDCGGKHKCSHCWEVDKNASRRRSGWKSTLKDVQGATIDFKHSGHRYHNDYGRHPSRDYSAHSRYHETLQQDW